MSLRVLLTTLFRSQVLEKTGFILKAKEVPVSAKKMHLVSSTCIVRFAPTSLFSPSCLSQLARQIAGLSLLEAQTQMALSEKRIAKTRIKQLMDSAW